MKKRNRSRRKNVTKGEPMGKGHAPVMLERGEKQFSQVNNIQKRPWGKETHFWKWLSSLTDKNSDPLIPSDFWISFYLKTRELDFFLFLQLYSLFSLTLNHHNPLLNASSISFLHSTTIHLPSHLLSVHNCVSLHLSLHHRTFLKLNNHHRKDSLHHHISSDIILHTPSVSNKPNSNHHSHQSELHRHYSPNKFVHPTSSISIASPCRHLQYKP